VPYKFLALSRLQTGFQKYISMPPNFHFFYKLENGKKIEEKVSAQNISNSGPMDSIILLPCRITGRPATMNSF
jgi:hypothetical protein